METASRRPALRLVAALALLTGMAAVIFGFSSAASAKSSGSGTATTQASQTPATVVPPLRGLTLLLNGLIHTLNTTVASLGTTVDNTGTLLGQTVNNTTTALTTTLTRTTNSLTTVVTGLLGGGGGTKTPTPPPNSTPPSNSPTSQGGKPSTSVSTPAVSASALGLILGPSDVPSLVGSRSTLGSSKPSSSHHDGGDITASKLLRTVSMLALVGMTGALALGVTGIVFGAGRRGRREG